MGCVFLYSLLTIVREGSVGTLKAGNEGTRSVLDDLLNNGAIVDGGCRAPEGLTAPVFDWFSPLRSALTIISLLSASSLIRALFESRSHFDANVDVLSFLYIHLSGISK
jgi:hypothetical protein